MERNCLRDSRSHIGVRLPNIVNMAESFWCFDTSPGAKPCAPLLFATD
jgi:hypothetical protein